MGKAFVLVCTFAILLGCASAPRGPDASGYTLPSDAIVLRIEVLDVQFTNMYPDPGCAETEMCVPFSFWWKYRARIKEVVSGAWSQPVVEFTHIQHGQYISMVTRDCFVILRPAEEEIRTKLGVPFVADRLLSRFFDGDRSAIKALRNGA